MRPGREDADDGSKKLNSKGSLLLLLVSPLRWQEIPLLYMYAFENRGKTFQRFDVTLPWGSASSLDRALSGSWNCSHPHPTHCHCVPAPSCPGGNRQPADGFPWKVVPVYGAVDIQGRIWKKNCLTDSHRDKVMWLSRWADWNLLPQLSNSILGLESISPIISSFFHSLFRVQSPFCFLTFSFFQCCGAPCLEFVHSFFYSFIPSFLLFFLFLF